MCAAKLPLAHKIITFHTTVTSEQKWENTNWWEEGISLKIYESNRSSSYTSVARFWLGHTHTHTHIYIYKSGLSRLPEHPLIVNLQNFSQKVSL